MTAKLLLIKSENGLETRQEYDGIALSQKGAANGVAGLDESGRIPSGQLPSYVDDVLEYSDFSLFPATGETGKIYLATGGTEANKTFRWSGSIYVEISASLALGETSATAYRGDRGKIAYDHSQATGNPHGTTATQIGALPSIVLSGVVDANSINEGLPCAVSFNAVTSWANFPAEFDGGSSRCALLQLVGGDAGSGPLTTQILFSTRWGGMYHRERATYSVGGGSWNPWTGIWDDGLLPVSTFMKTVLDDTSASNARMTLGAAPLAGVTNGSDASSGVVGEYLEAKADEAARVYAINGSAVSVLSLSLPAGDWVVEGRATAYITGAMAGNKVVSGLNTSVAIPTDGTEVYGGMQVFSSINGFQTMTGSKRFSLVATTTVYLVGRIDFSAGTPALFGFMSARRVR